MEDKHGSEVVSIDNLLAKLRMQEKDLKFSLSTVQSKIKSLLEARALLTGQEYEPAPEKSIPDLLEEILRERGVKHVDDLVFILNTEFPQTRSVAKQTVSGALIRYANQGRRFKRVGKNMFDLLGK